MMPLALDHYQQQQQQQQQQQPDIKMAAVGGRTADVAQHAEGLYAAADAAVGLGLTKQQQKQQEEEMQRAVSGCLGLWSPTSTSSSSNAAAAALMDPLSPIAATQQQQQQQVLLPPSHLFSVSAGVCPAIFWLGRYADGRFDLSSAVGPVALDLGDVLYAPNLLEDPQVRLHGHAAAL
jgi:hypothetical protein